jgi:hypothetical protein
MPETPRANASDMVVGVVIGIAVGLLCFASFFACLKYMKQGLSTSGLIGTAVAIVLMLAQAAVYLLIKRQSRLMARGMGFVLLIFWGVFAAVLIVMILLFGLAAAM